MGKPIKFSDPLFFGRAYTTKFNEYKAMRLREIGHVNLMGIMPDLMAINNMERNHRERLTALAIQKAKEFFPMIDILKLQIDAAIGERISHNDISDEGTPDEPEDMPEDEDFDEELYKRVAKQKILDALGQGAAVSMNQIHHMVNELDEISPNLKNTYDRLMKANEYAYLTIPQDDFAQMAMQSNRNGQVGGTNRIEHREEEQEQQPTQRPEQPQVDGEDEEDGMMVGGTNKIEHRYNKKNRRVPFIVARGMNFVTLIHEIVKGLYSYIALCGYTSEYDYYEIEQYTASIANEIEDIGCGKMMIGLLKDYLLEHCDKYYQHEAFFEVFIVKMARLEPNEIKDLMNGFVINQPNKKKIEQIAQECFYDLKDFEKKKLGL